MSHKNRFVRSNHRQMNFQPFSKLRSRQSGELRRSMKHNTLPADELAKLKKMVEDGLDQAALGLGHFIGFLLQALCVWMLWDDCMVPLFQTPDITYWQSLALIYVLRLAFNIRGGTPTK